MLQVWVVADDDRDLALQLFRLATDEQVEQAVVHLADKHRHPLDAIRVRDLPVQAEARGKVGDGTLQDGGVPDACDDVAVVEVDALEELVGGCVCELRTQGAEAKSRRQSAYTLLRKGSRFRRGGRRQGKLTFTCVTYDISIPALFFCSTDHLKVLCMSLRRCQHRIGTTVSQHRWGEADGEGRRVRICARGGVSARGRML